MVGDIFDCVGELVEEKTKLVESIADFVSEKVSFYFLVIKHNLNIISDLNSNVLYFHNNIS